ncbi:MAG: 6-bladed beta-propeller, partial [Prevotellaceae bacterium]|nr:6-bladed beta-propeller [Prevotellaceae bacterium]
MRTIQKSLFIGVIWWGISCNYSPQISTGLETIVLSDETMKEQKIKLSHFAEKIQYIFLETNDESVISKIDKILFHKEFCIVMDGKLSAILVFDTTGHFIRKIDHHGNGPGEYLKLTDITVSEDGCIHVLDSEQSKMLHYSLTGTWVSESSHFPERSRRIAPLGDEYLVTWAPRGQFVHNHHHSLAVYNQKDQKINRMVDRSSERLTEKDAWKMPFYSASVLDRYVDTLTYWEFRYDTVYRIIDANTCIPRYYLEYADKMPMDVFYASPEAKNYTNIRYYVETDNYIFFYMSHHNKPTQIVYDKKEKT